MLWHSYPPNYKNTPKEEILQSVSPINLPGMKLPWEPGTKRKKECFWKDSYRFQCSLISTAINFTGMLSNETLTVVTLLKLRQ
jgi:hypothetical protein